jgi:hypothetical protein
METLRDPALLKEAKKSQLAIAPVNGPTIAKMMADLYDLSAATRSKLAKLLLPSGMR